MGEEGALGRSVGREKPLRDEMEERFLRERCGERGGVRREEP